jgi:hypothetical protein
MKLPANIIKKIESEAINLNHGKIILEIHLRDGHPVRFIINREESIMPTDVGVLI